MGNIPKESLERLLYFRSEVEKILRDFFESAGEDLEGDSSAIPTDVLETAGEVVITAEMPGYARDGIRLEVSRDRLLIEGEKGRGAKREKVKYLCAERGYGRYKRVIPLPTACDTRRIRAGYRNGILTITIPKISERREASRKVEIDWGEK
jgi:HSP20 family protein